MLSPNQAKLTASVKLASNTSSRKLSEIPAHKGNAVGRRRNREREAEGKKKEKELGVML